jgi:hypothetical protein
MISDGVLLVYNSERLQSNLDVHLSQIIIQQDDTHRQ